MKKSKKITKKRSKLSKLSKKTKILISILVVGVIGLVAINIMNAGPNDGYQRIRIINTAAAEVGHREWDSRVMQYTENKQEPWCADFVSWVYKTAGYPFNAGSVAGRSSWRIALAHKRYDGHPNLRDYNALFGAYKTRQSGYVPAPGDIIIFGDTDSHAGIVEKVATNPSKNAPWVYTIEGNIADGTGKDVVGRKAYPLNDSSIHGYGTIIDNPSVIQSPSPSK